MKCCKKFVAVAVLVALGIVTVAAVRSGWGRVVKDHIAGAFKSHVPPEIQLERVKILIKDLDKEIAKGWTPIAKREIQINDLKKDLETKTSKLEGFKAELQAGADALDKNVKRVSYNNKDYTPIELRRALSRDLILYKGLSREVESKTKLLAAWEKELQAMKANQDEMKNKKDELETQVAQIEADLKVLRLAETKSSMPVGDQSKLDDIKATLAELTKENDIRLRVLELSAAHDRGENVSSTTKEDTTDELIKKIKRITGDNSEDVGGK